MAAFYEESKTSYTDFSSPTLDYSSYFVTGPKINGEGQRSTQVEYITVFANDVPYGSFYVRGRWDWAEDSSTGKWSTEQQGYSKNRDLRKVSRKRLLLRGSGPALQLQFRSQSGKPFEILGWSQTDSVDAKS